MGWWVSSRKKEEGTMQLGTRICEGVGGGGDAVVGREVALEDREAIAE